MIVSKNLPVVSQTDNDASNQSTNVFASEIYAKLCGSVGKSFTLLEVSILSVYQI